MKKNCFILKNNKMQKILYYILVGLALISFIAGCLFIFTLDNDTKSLIKESIISFFNQDISYISNFFKSLFNNYIYIIIIWILGISIIGIPIILLMFVFKSFIIGFSVSSLLNTFGAEGILHILIYLLPNKLMFLIVLILISFYSISFSLKLFKSFFTKKVIDLKYAISKYLKTLLICLIVLLFISLYDGIISIYLIKLFNI